ncbi:alpha/beta hydrolase [Streptomyces sp. ET3-23]|uniref:alpha/beta fold hydrolase n=1 Tax=Streptomyces sp. ET3-23 TaxID=2885643 RepID=UPI001D10E08A|nr:alpha/beta hydrolase [Streptomyces sp. ET3-23]MCC2276962.1 alpha/beta hydrolase [Streptomyces sp. ET3-23]
MPGEPPAPVAGHLLPGSGPVLVAVHGAEGSWQEWRPLARQLREHHRVLALDLPWRAGNDYAWVRHGSAGAWLQRTLAALDEQPAALLGHSLGANAVLECIGAHRGTVPAVLFAPFFRASAGPVDRRLYEEFCAAFRYAVGDGMRVALGERAARLDPALFASMVDIALERVGQHGLRTLFGHFTRTAELDLAGDAPPALVLAGERDPALAGARALALASAMPRATVAHRAGYGHCFHVERAGPVAEDVVEFLRKAAG